MEVSLIISCPDGKYLVLMTSSGRSILPMIYRHASKKSLITSATVPSSNQTNQSTDIYLVVQIVIVAAEPAMAFLARNALRSASIPSAAVRPAVCVRSLHASNLRAAMSEADHGKHATSSFTHLLLHRQQLDLHMIGNTIALSCRFQA